MTDQDPTAQRATPPQSSPSETAPSGELTNESKPWYGIRIGVEIGRKASLVAWSVLWFASSLIAFVFTPTLAELVDRSFRTADAQREAKALRTERDSLKKDLEAQLAEAERN